MLMKLQNNVVDNPAFDHCMAGSITNSCKRNRIDLLPTPTLSCQACYKGDWPELKVRKYT